MVVYLKVDFPDVKKIYLKENKIFCKDTTPTPSSYVFHGKVIYKINKYDYYQPYANYVKLTEVDKEKDWCLILDIGVGTIEVHLDKPDYKYEKFSIGDYVEVSNGRIDIGGITNNEEVI